MPRKSNEIVFMVPASKRPIRVRITFDVKLEAGDRLVTPLPPDGMIEPNIVAWGNQRVTLEPGEWRLLNAVLSTASKSLSFDEALAAIGTEMSEPSLRKKCSTIASRLAPIGYHAAGISYKKGYVILEPPSDDVDDIIISIEGGFVDNEGAKLAYEDEDEADTKTPPTK